MHLRVPKVAHAVLNNPDALAMSAHFTSHTCRSRAGHDSADGIGWSNATEWSYLGDVWHYASSIPKPLLCDAGGLHPGCAKHAETAPGKLGASSL